MRTRFWAVPALAIALGACGGGGSKTTSGTTTGSGGSGGGSFLPAAHPPFPVLPPNDASELLVPRLVVIVGPGDPLASQLFAFGDALVKSAWLAAMGHDYGLAATAGPSSLHLTGAAVPATMGEIALRAYVTATIAANPAAAADGHTIYLFFYPPGTGRGDGCGDLGAHSTLLDTGYVKGTSYDALAWAQRCPNPTGITELAGLTLTASHEVAESATDAYPPHGFAMPVQLWPQTGSTPPWADPSWSYLQGDAVEAADLCEGTILDEGAFSYQRIWSTKAAAAGGDPCVPQIEAPYYSVAAPHDWIVVPAGSIAMVPVVGWSTGPRADWVVTVNRAATHEGGFTPLFASGGVTTSGMNNGVTAMLTVTTPAAPGAFVVYELESSESPPDPTTGLIPAPASGDRKHTWVFGIRTTCAGCTEPPTCGDGTCETGKGETCASCPDDCGACGAVCGASNLAVPCGAAACPANATCQAGTCACDAGFTSVTCEGQACSGASCVSPGWWCVPSTCGNANFTAPCGSGFCPSGALCTPDLQCACGPGSLSATCEGQPCPSGGCTSPDYWCTLCGAPNGRVTCSDGTTCPSFSACVSGPPTSCSCLSGFRAVTCAGASCSSENPCSDDNWWCVSD